MLKNATIETTTTYKLTTKDIEDLILNQAGLNRAEGVSIRFDVTETIADDYYPYTPAQLVGAIITVTAKATL